MKRLLYYDTGFRVSLGLLVVRLLTGAAFIVHGWPKIQSPFSWMPADAGIPGVVQMLGAVTEFGGGIALILGFLTPVVCLALGVMMTVAIGMVHLPAGDPFVAKGGGASYELAAGYLANVVALLLAGPGRISVDALLFRRTPAS